MNLIKDSLAVKIFLRGRNRLNDQPLIQMYYNTLLYKRLRSIYDIS